MSLTAKEIAIRSAFVLMGVLTATPVLALINPAQLESYGVLNPGAVELSLLQHRGLLQFALGASLVYAAFRPDVRVAVALAAIVTKGGFLLLTFMRPEVLAKANMVAMVFDPLCIVLLTAVLVDVFRTRSPNAIRSARA